MKRLFPIFGLAFLMIFQACEGPAGPAGPQGPEGPQGLQGVPGDDGFNFVGTTYEAEANFNADNDYGELFAFPEELFEGDVVLVYRLSGFIPETESPVWRQIPQTIFFEEGVLMYNFDFTTADFAVFLDGPIDFSILGPEWTDQQIFRIVVVPSDFPDGRIDFSNYEAVMTWLDIEEEDFVRISSK